MNRCFALLFVAITGCASTVHPVFTSESPRIWVVEAPGTGDQVVMRCADGAAPTDLPKPVCVRATVVSSDK